MPQYRRVYANPKTSYRGRVLSPSEVEAQVEHDAKFRPGVAVFIDGECRQTGYLTQERCDAISAELKLKLN